MSKNALFTMTMMLAVGRRRPLMLATCLGTWLVTVGTSNGFVVEVPAAAISKRHQSQFDDAFSKRRHADESTTTQLHSLSSPQQQQEQKPSSSIESWRSISSSPLSTLQDVLCIVAFVLSCVMLAIAISLYQDYDVSHTKPQGPLRERAILGLAYYGDTSDDNDVPAYNTVMQHHRNVRVQMWKQQQQDYIMTREDAISTIIQTLQELQQLKIMANNYKWEKMQETIRSPILSTQLEEACSVLRRTAPTPEARDEIGFDWGSCAWRHCGAQADAQESLAELYNLLGVLEPFECLFCLDIIERSLHDILAVCNVDISTVKVPTYIPYQARGQEDGDSALDMDFLQALQGVKTSFDWLQ